MGGQEVEVEGGRDHPFLVTAQGGGVAADEDESFGIGGGQAIIPSNVKIGAVGCGIDVPLGPVVMTAVIAWYGWQFRQRTAQRHRPPIGRAA